MPLNPVNPVNPVNPSDDNSNLPDDTIYYYSYFPTYHNYPDFDSSKKYITNSDYKRIFPKWTEDHPGEDFFEHFHIMGTN